MQRSLAAIEPVQVRDQPADAGCRGVVGARPRQRSAMVPLAGLCVFPAHEQQLRTRVSPLPGVQQSQVRVSLPGVAGHPAEQRVLAVYHLVVRQRQQLALRPCIVDRLHERLVMVPAEQRVYAEVAERVVHPAQAPLVVEAKPASGDRRRGAGSDRRILCVQVDAREIPPHERGQRPQPGDRRAVLVAAFGIGKPLAGRPPVVEVEHRGDRVHAQPVDVELLQPVARARQQERAHLWACEVERQRPPATNLGAPRILWLVQRLAVEAHQRLRIGREMPRHPVQDHAEVRPV